MNNTKDKPSLMSANLQSFLWQRTVELLGLSLHSLALSTAEPDDSNENDPHLTRLLHKKYKTWAGRRACGCRTFSDVWVACLWLLFGAIYLGVRLITDKCLHRWKWRLPVLFISVVLLGMAAYGVFDTAETDRAVV